MVQCFWCVCLQCVTAPSTRNVTTRSWDSVQARQRTVARRRFVLLLFYYYYRVYFTRSVLWHCWIGDKKGIWPIKIPTSAIPKDSILKTLWEITIVLQCFVTVGWVIWPVKIVPTNVFVTLLFYFCYHVYFARSVLWHCWMGDKKGIWPIKIPTSAIPKIPFWKLFGS